MAKQGKTGPSRLQLILLAVAIIMTLLGGAMNFFPNAFPISGEELTTAGLITVIISAIFTFWLLFTVATKRKKA